jgi:thioredoxin-related protein
MELVMRLSLPVFFFALLLSLGASAAETRDPDKYFFNETFGNFSEELQNAKAEGKQGVLIFFEMAECPFCHYMKNNVLNRPDVQAYYRQHFLNFTVDIEGDIEITDFHGKQLAQKDFAFKENRVRATPVIAFYDLTGKEVFRHTGRTADAKEFLLIGQYVAEGTYKKMPFTKYKRAQRN